MRGSSVRSPELDGIQPRSRSFSIGHQARRLKRYSNNRRSMFLSNLDPIVACSTLDSSCLAMGRCNEWPMNDHFPHNLSLFTGTECLQCLAQRQLMRTFARRW
ncbi:hypothetical protein CaCOL14_011031 [Colletotrichum acutatum]